MNLDERNLNVDHRSGKNIFTEGRIVLEIHHDGSENPRDHFFYSLKSTDEWFTVATAFCKQIQSGTNFRMQACNKRVVSENHVVCDTKSDFIGIQYAK